MQVAGRLTSAIKKSVKSAVGAGFLFLLENAIAFKDLCIILMYHRVVERLPEEPYDRDICVTARTFDLHMDLLRRFFTMMPLEQMALTRPGGRICAVTFDDGWLDNYRVAFPILKRHEVPATIFLPVAMIGTDQWFWFESIWDLVRKAFAACKQEALVNYFCEIAPAWQSKGTDTADILTLIGLLKNENASALEALIGNAYRVVELETPRDRILLNWEEAKEMGKGGITFGSHGLNHCILPTLSYREKEEEVKRSLSALMAHEVPVCRVFCFPNGNWDEDCLKLLSDSGYISSVTTKSGRIRQDTPTFLLNRIGIHEDVSSSPALFAYRLYQGCR